MTCELKNKVLCTFQPLDLCLDWNDSLIGQHTQLKTGPCQRLYEEFHSVIERDLIMKSSHTVVVKEGWLLPVGHPGRLEERDFRETAKWEGWPKMRERGTGTAHRPHNRCTSCRMTTAVRRTKSIDCLKHIFSRFDLTHYQPQQWSVLDLMCSPKVDMVTVWSSELDNYLYIGNRNVGDIHKITQDVHDGVILIVKYYGHAYENNLLERETCFVVRFNWVAFVWKQEHASVAADMCNHLMKHSGQHLGPGQNSRSGVT